MIIVHVPSHPVPNPSLPSPQRVTPLSHPQCRLPATPPTCSPFNVQLLGSLMPYPPLIAHRLLQALQVVFQGVNFKPPSSRKGGGKWSRKNDTTSEEDAEEEEEEDYDED